MNPHERIEPPMPSRSAHLAGVLPVAGPSRSLLLRVTGGGVAVAVTALGLCAAPALAAGPVALQKATPSLGSSVSSPGAVTLTFDQDLTIGRLRVTGPNGNAAGGSAAIYGMQLTEPLADGLPVGTYQVTWVAKARGTRRSVGSYSFRIVTATPKASPTTTPSPSGPSGAVPTVRSTASPSASSSPAGHDPASAPAASGSPAPALGSPVPHPSLTGTSVAVPAPSDTAVEAASDRTSAVTGTDRVGPEPAVSRLVSGSRAMSAWLIGIAVLLQVGAGLWGLWRWRRGRTDPEPGVADAAGEPDLLPRQDARLAMQQVWADRPWTGELPLRREKSRPTTESPVPPL